jgi:hypothetical protein
MVAYHGDAAGKWGRSEMQRDAARRNRCLCNWNKLQASPRPKPSPRHAPEEEEELEAKRVRMMRQPTAQAARFLNATYDDPRLENPQANIIRLVTSPLATARSGTDESAETASEENDVGRRGVFDSF